MGKTYYQDLKAVVPCTAHLAAEARNADTGTFAFRELEVAPVV